MDIGTARRGRRSGIALGVAPESTRKGRVEEVDSCSSAGFVARDSGDLADYVQIRELSLARGWLHYTDLGVGSVEGVLHTVHYEDRVCLSPEELRSSEGEEDEDTPDLLPNSEVVYRLTIMGHKLRTGRDWEGRVPGSAQPLDAEIPWPEARGHTDSELKILGAGKADVALRLSLVYMRQHFAAKRPDNIASVRNVKEREAQWSSSHAYDPMVQHHVFSYHISAGFPNGACYCYRFGNYVSIVQSDCAAVLTFEVILRGCGMCRW
jgi:hypothetical protein